MGFFDLKAVCINCRKEMGLHRYKVMGGWLCPDCFKLCGYNFTMPIRTKTITDIQADIEEEEKQKQRLASFEATKKISSFIEFDEEKRQWLVRGGILFASMKNQRVYDFDEIIEYELLEDGDSIIKGGMGRALVGGLLLGRTGAIVGGVTGEKKSKKIINSLKIKITVNDFKNPTVYINLINTKTKADSFVYKSIYDTAQQILSTFSLIQKQNENQEEAATIDEPQNTILSSADEILKFKALLDSGVISQEEFEVKKRKLLDL